MTPLFSCIFGLSISVGPRMRNFVKFSFFFFQKRVSMCNSLKLRAGFTSPAINKRGKEGLLSSSVESLPYLAYPSLCFRCIYSPLLLLVSFEIFGHMLVSFKMYWMCYNLCLLTLPPTPPAPGSSLSHTFPCPSHTIFPGLMSQERAFKPSPARWPKK